MKTIGRQLKTVAIDLRYYLRNGNAAGLSMDRITGDDPSSVRMCPAHADNGVRVGDRVYQLFFLCGHPRSGTHWTAALLNRHPHINCRGEFRFEGLRAGFDDFVEHDWHAAYREPTRTVAEACFQDTIRCCMASVANQRPEARWIGDRTPRTLDVFIPGAPHFIIFRDGRDVAVSWAIHQIRNGGDIFARPFFTRALAPIRERFLADPDYFKHHPHDLLSNEQWVRHIAGVWAAHARHDLAAVERIRSGDVNARVHELRYERLHRDPDGERVLMYEFLGLDPALAHPLDDETKTTPGFRSDDHTKFFRFGRVGEWGRYFSGEARRWFKEEAGPELIRLGYEQDNAW